jgi:hypothetical protein
MMVAAASLVSACDGGGGGSGAGGASGASGGAPAGNGGDGGGSGGDSRGGAGGGGGGGSGGGAGAGGVGGGMCSPSCGVTEYCDWSGNNCAGTGTCRSKPLDCITPEQVVCGCNDKLYRSSCDANAAGVDVMASGGCAPPPGTFICGTRFCTQGTQYCETTVRGSGSVRVCRDLPAGCGATPTCACLASVPDCQCMVAANGELTTTCVLPP